MKKITVLLTLLMMNVLAFAQTDGINYQAVIIDNNPQEIPGVDIPSNNLPNVPLEVRFTILDDSNMIIYQETHQTETDPFGMINLMIGQGAMTASSPSVFNQIYWNNPKLLRVEIDLFDGNGFVAFSNQKLTYIPYVKHREIIATSTLDVDGETNLNNNLTVNNQSPTYLTGDLTVDGLVSFDGELAVGGDTNLYSDLTVSGNTLLEGNLNVIGTSNFSNGIFENITVTQNSALNVLDVDGVTNLNNAFNVNNGNLSSLSGNLSVDGGTSLNSTLTVSGISTMNNTLNVNSISNLNGRVVIDANMDAVGGDLFSAAHPLRVKGSRQGISIELTGNSGGTPTNGNNFLSFTGANNTRYGRIEGQTQSELTSSFEYVWYSVQEGLQYAFQLAMIVVDLIGVDDADAAVVEGFEMVNIIANWATLNVHRFNNVGVAFESGFGDYAEWLEKNNKLETFSYGDVVAVVGGKITKNTQMADHMMVISKNPIVLGNMPEANRDADFEKVAFMGQVPVKVMGKVNIGDYIIPSGHNDGIGVAISPEKLKIEAHPKIVGVAWSSSTDNGLSMVNLAVGINTNSTAQLLQAQQTEIKLLKSNMNKIINYLNENDSNFNLNPLEINDTIQPNTSDDISINEVQYSEVSKNNKDISKYLDSNSEISESTKTSLKEIIRMLEQNSDKLDEILFNAREYLDKKGVDYNRYEQTRLMVTDRHYFLSYLRQLAK